MRKTFLSAALLVSVAWPAFAQSPAQPTLPEGLTDGANLVYQGQSGGLDYWFFPGSDYIISQNPADGSVLIGYLFDNKGQDVSAVITGSEPLTFDDFFVDKGEETSSAPEISGSSTLADLVPQPGIAQQDNMLIESAPEAVRNELLAELVERLTAVNTREEYENVLLAWREEVRETLGNQPAPAVPQDIMDILGGSGQVERTPETPVQEVPSAANAQKETAPQDAQEANAQNSLSSLMPPPPADEPTGDISEDSLDAATELDQADIMANPITALMPSTELAPPAVDDDAMNALAFETLSTQSRWFSLGSETAPVVYVVIDPTCPYCARTLVDLEDDVKNGELQLRVVMAGLLSEQAIETVAGILLSETPAETLFENAHARAGGEGRQAPRRNASDLPEEVLNDLAVNRQNIIDLGVSEVPYFAWQTDSGFKTASGVPVEGQFADARSAETAQ